MDVLNRKRLNAKEPQFQIPLLNMPAVNDSPPTIDEIMIAINEMKNVSTWD
jgi:hypothetical protein